MSNDNEKLPVVLLEGVIKIGDVSLRVYKLDSGQTVIHEDDIHKFFESFGEGTVATVIEEETK